MNFSWSMLYTGQLNLITLGCSMLLAKLFSDEKLFSRYTSLVLPHHRKLQLLITAVFTGVLPISKRMNVALPLYTDLTNSDNTIRSIQTNQKMGIVSYLATHHYGLWSPLGSPAIITMACFGFSYASFMNFMLPFLISYLAFLAYYIHKCIEVEEIALIPNRSWYTFNTAVIHVIPFLMSVLVSFYVPPHYVFPVTLGYYFCIFKFPLAKVLNNFDYSLFFQIAMLIVLSNILKANNVSVSEFLIGTGNESYVILTFLLLGTVLTSFTLGSAVKYSGITVLFCSVFGVHWFPLVFSLEYAGYFMSPSHRCIGVSYKAFNTPVLYFYTTLFSLNVFLVTIGFLELSISRI
jgi:hypothetical protein